MTTLYTTKATAIGGRNGSVKTDDGLFEAHLAMPTALGGKGNATNPEQLFAAGYAACFGNAVLFVARSQGVNLKDQAVEVAAEVGIGPRPAGGFQLSVSLQVVLTGLTQEQAEAVVTAAHQVCPYSNATRGNIDVAIQTQVR